MEGTARVRTQMNHTNDISDSQHMPVNSASDRPQEERNQFRGDDGAGDSLSENEIRISGNPSLSLQSDVLSGTQLPSESTWNVEFNPDTEVALSVNLAHALTKNTAETYAAFSVDGKYLATVSENGVVQIFDVKTGKKLR